MVRSHFAVACALAILAMVSSASYGRQYQEAGKPSTQPETTKPPADPDDVPITKADVKMPTDYPDAVSRIKRYRDSIRDEIAAGRPTKAHRPLDELNIVLKALPDIAKVHGVPSDKLEQVGSTAKRIRELFNKVHANIDAKKAPDFDGVSKDIDKEIGVLEKIKATQSAPKS
ncbi:MAG: hypothetical protein BGO49_27580 [Planctomycetales bacterium 71-10]|nr:MAG: hypothetical protein BGO49_27580 [Planctomycetales bacterium 71-10]